MKKIALSIALITAPICATAQVVEIEHIATTQVPEGWYYKFRVTENGANPLPEDAIEVFIDAGTPEAKARELVEDAARDLYQKRKKANEATPLSFPGKMVIRKEKPAPPLPDPAPPKDK